jgi:uncharacterized protein
MQDSRVDMEFNCTACGMCCANAGKYVDSAKEQLLAGNKTDLVKDVSSFPHDYDLAGKCEMLGDDNKCKVYENRPDICNVEKTRDKHFNWLSKEKYFEITEGLCKQIQENGL